MTINQQADLRLLQVRSLIANKEMEIATANRELSLGGNWLSDHQLAINQLDAEIEHIKEQMHRDA